MFYHLHESGNVSPASCEAAQPGRRHSLPIVGLRLAHLRSNDPERAKGFADLAFLGAEPVLLAFLRFLGEPQGPAGGVTLLDDQRLGLTVIDVGC